VQELVIGMAHRGRINVLVNTMGKMPKDLFAEFEGSTTTICSRATSSTTWGSRRTS
jgi:2-oxoglutarate dehydrogenase complex dehydrogenase (E1) component-like enzyme